MRSTQTNSGLASPKSTEVRPLTVGWSTVDRCPIGCVMHQSSPAHGRRLHVLCLGCPGPPARKAIRHHHWMGWAGGAVEPRTITGRTRCNSGQHTPTICLSRLHFFLNQCIAPASGFFLPSARRHVNYDQSVIEDPCFPSRYFPCHNVNHSPAGNNIFRFVLSRSRIGDRFHRSTTSRT